MKIVSKLDQSDNLNIPSLRLLVLLSHFVLTTGLVWTKIDAIQVTIAFNDDVKYRESKVNYETAIGFGLTLMIFRFLFFFSSYGHVSIISVYNLVFDCIACLFISWMILDGFAWYNYLFVLFFCVLMPFILDLIIMGGYIIQKMFKVNRRRDTPWYVRLYYYLRPPRNS